MRSGTQLGMPSCCCCCCSNRCRTSAPRHSTHRRRMSGAPSLAAAAPPFQATSVGMPLRAKRGSPRSGCSGVFQAAGEGEGRVVKFHQLGGALKARSLHTRTPVALASSAYLRAGRPHRPPAGSRRRPPLPAAPPPCCLHGSGNERDASRADDGWRVACAGGQATVHLAAGCSTASKPGRGRPAGRLTDAVWAPVGCRMDGCDEEGGGGNASGAHKPTAAAPTHGSSSELQAGAGRPAPKHDVLLPLVSHHSTPIHSPLNRMKAPCAGSAASLASRPARLLMAAGTTAPRAPLLMSLPRRRGRGRSGRAGGARRWSGCAGAGGERRGVFSSIGAAGKQG